MFARFEDPIDRVYGILETYRSFLVQSEFTLGCPVGSLAIELGDEHAEARARIAETFGELHSAIARCFRDSSLPEGAAPLLANFVLTVIEGGIVQARATRSIKPFDQATACLKDYIDRMDPVDRADTHVRADTHFPSAS